MKQQLSIIIVHWNTPLLLEKQLTSLAHFGGQIIVVDNNSDKPLTSLKKLFPAVDFIENGLNRGFAFACNQAVSELARRSLDERGWLLFLNPDVAIDEEKITTLINFAENNHLDACSPIPENNHYLRPVPTTLSLLAEFTPLKHLISDRFFKNKTLTGGLLLIKKDAFLDLGGFDERFFLWFEDSDLTKRLIDHNYKIGWAPVEIKHRGGASFSKLNDQIKRDIFFHSTATFAKKHFSFLGQLVVNIIRRHYSTRKILPSVYKGVCLTVPNVKPQLLSDFLKNNWDKIDKNTEVIVVSSGFTNKTVWDYRKKFPRVRFVPISQNRGVATTINIGFNVSTTDWIGTVNDDTILTADWIDKCLACANEKTGALNPLIYKPDGTLESAGVDILPRGKALPRKVVDNGPYFQVDAVNAAIVLYSNDALNKTGIYDERFGSYLEDIDHSLRMTRNGFDNIVVTNAKVTHIGQATSKNLGAKKQFYDARNWIYVIVKNWGVKKIIFNFPGLFIERLRNISGVLKSL